MLIYTIHPNIEIHATAHTSPFLLSHCHMSQKCIIRHCLFLKKVDSFLYCFYFTRIWDFYPY